MNGETVPFPVPYSSTCFDLLQKKTFVTSQSLEKSFARYWIRSNRNTELSSVSSSESMKNCLKDSIKRLISDGFCHDFRLIHWVDCSSCHRFPMEGTHLHLFFLFGYLTVCLHDLFMC